ncbi:uncharacterized ABC transporter ATP-binding protein Mb1304c [Arthrobacter sp. Hiyo8]|nr:uncharacterized ABC transporter ATP-binding protein Mb1304c [Arthrobacter sp. Hiyo8]
MLASLLLQRLAPYKPHVLAIVLLQLVQTGATLLLPTFNAKIVDDGLVAGNSEVILRLGTWMLVLTVIQVLAAVLAGYLGAIVAMKVGRGLRQELFDKIHSLPDQDVAAFGPAASWSGRRMMSCSCRTSRSWFSACWWRRPSWASEA